MLHYGYGAFDAYTYGNFTYYEHPRIDGVVPGGGPVQGGTIITLVGKGFHVYGTPETWLCRFRP